MLDDQRVLTGHSLSITIFKLFCTVSQYFSTSVFHLINHMDDTLFTQFANCTARKKTSSEA